MKSACYLSRNIQTTWAHLWMSAQHHTWLWRLMLKKDESNFFKQVSLMRKYSSRSHSQWVPIYSVNTVPVRFMTTSLIILIDKGLPQNSFTSRHDTCVRGCSYTFTAEHVCLEQGWVQKAEGAFEKQRMIFLPSLWPAFVADPYLFWIVTYLFHWLLRAFLISLRMKWKATPFLKIWVTLCARTCWW